MDERLSALLEATADEQLAGRMLTLPSDPDADHVRLDDELDRRRRPERPWAIGAAAAALVLLVGAAVVVLSNGGNGGDPANPTVVGELQDPAEIVRSAAGSTMAHPWSGDSQVGGVPGPDRLSYEPEDQFLLESVDGSTDSFVDQENPFSALFGALEAAPSATPVAGEDGRYDVDGLPTQLCSGATGAAPPPTCEVVVTVRDGRLVGVTLDGGSEDMSVSIEIGPRDDSVRVPGP